MEFELVALNYSKLSNLEAGDLIKQHKTDISQLPAGLVIDAPLNNFLTLTWGRSTQYEKSIMKIRLKDESKMIAEADDKRDNALSVLFSTIKIHLKSDIVSEKQAAQSLENLASIYKGLAKESYSAETEGIDKLILDLESETYNNKIIQLAMTGVVIRLKEANKAFKLLYSNRTLKEAMAETFNAKEERKELYEQYELMNSYLISMTNGYKTEQFIKVLSVINAARKKSADLIAFRDGLKRNIITTENKTPVF